MLCPAAVSAAVVAGWLLLAVVGLGHFLPAEDTTEPGFSLCSRSFYRQTPPRGASEEAPLRPLCHALPSGQAFATLHNPTCDTAVCSAFRLSRGRTERGGEEGDALVTENEEDDMTVLKPALLQGGEISSPADSPLQRWDSTVTALVQSSVIPQCDSLGGDLYILTGTGGLGAAGDGNEHCKATLFWSAVCCAASVGEGGFSVGLVRESEEGERVVSVNELEEILGAAELFSEGCGGTDGVTEAGIASRLGEALLGNIEKLDPDTTSQDSDTTSQDSDVTGPDSDENVGETVEAPITGEQPANLEAEAEEAQVADVTHKTSAEEVTSESAGEGQSDTTQSDAARSESVRFTDDNETVAAVDPDTESNSTLVYIISTTISILTAPLHPVVSTITQLPGQVTYVLQEDLGVLSAIPGDTVSLIQLMVDNLGSGVGSAVDILLDLGETFFSGMYYCASSMLAELLTSCQIGVIGMGTLASDTVGIFRGAVDNAWWVTRFFGGRLWEQSEGYIGTVVSEMGDQVAVVGEGLGKLLWRSGNGVGNVVRFGGGLITGTLEIVMNAVMGAFGQQSD
ncbi:uncharacterized protein ACJ7VT_020704 [Polymixia lowei]